MRRAHHFGMDFPAAWAARTTKIGNLRSVQQICVTTHSVRPMLVPASRSHAGQLQMTGIQGSLAQGCQDVPAKQRKNALDIRNRTWFQNVFWSAGYRQLEGSGPPRELRNASEKVRPPKHQK
jgi:hypothetical protein